MQLICTKFNNTELAVLSFPIFSDERKHQVQVFLSVKIYTQDAIPITSKKDVKIMLVKQLIFHKIKNFTVKVLQYKYSLAYVNFQRAEVCICSLFPVTCMNIKFLRFVISILKSSLIYSRMASSVTS